MNNACLVELSEHHTYADAETVVAEEAATWLGYCVLNDEASVALSAADLSRNMLSKMADIPIAWNRVTVTTTSDCLVPDLHPLSSIGIVRRAFRGRYGQHARFVPLDKHPIAPLPFDLVILALGEDCDMPPPIDEVAQDTSEGAGLVAYGHRAGGNGRIVSSRRWNLRALLSGPRTLILCRGEGMRTAIDEALNGSEDTILRTLIADARGVITIHWAEA